MDNTLVSLDKDDPAGLTKGRLEQNQGADPEI